MVLDAKEDDISRQANITQGKLVYSIEELSLKSSLSKGFLRNEIKAKKLKAKKFGARVLVLVADWCDYANSREEYKPAQEIAPQN